MNVVQGDHIQPQFVGDLHALEQVAPLHSMHPNGFLLRSTGAFTLQCQLVLQLGHANVHRQRGMHQGIALQRGQAIALGQQEFRVAHTSACDAL